MDIKTVFNKNKYSLCVFILLAMPSLIFDNLESAEVLVCKLLLCLCVTLFLSLRLSEKASPENVVFPAFMLLSLICCNVIFTTNDIHILLSISSFFIALFMSEKFMWLTAVFAGLCVMAQPLTILILVPAIAVVQLTKKQVKPAIASIIISIAAFVLIKLLATNTGFYAQQSGAYYLWLHPVFFSKTHTDYLLKYLLYSFPLVAMVLFFIAKLINKRKILIAVYLVLTIILALYGFSLSKNIHTVFMILLSVFAVIVAIEKSDDTKKISEDIAKLFTQNLFVFFLMIALTVALPMILGSLPHDSDFFDKATFIIFKEE